MADLNQLQSSDSTKVVGSDSSGNETNPLAVDSSGNAQTVINNTTLPLPTGAATSAKQDLLLTELQLKADLTETQPVIASASDLLMYEMTNEFKEMNKNLKIIIKQLSYITEQEED